MKFFDVIPLAGFLLILVFLTNRILVLRRKGIAVSKGPRKLKKSTFLFYLVFGLVLLVWFFEIIKPAFQHSFSILPEILTNRLFESILLKFLGAILILISLVLWTITLIHFKTSLRFGLDEKNQEKLVTTGIFSISRNPFFLSLNIYFLGIAFIFPNPFFIGFAVLAIVSIHFYILKEERYLRKVYGEEYKRYEEKVRRYF